MKTIGLLGGTSWTSTISYYSLLNQLVNKHLGGQHSARLLLKSIDYHEIFTNYDNGANVVAELLKQELADLISLNPDCIMICCNSLHKFYNIIEMELKSDIPVFHAIRLVAKAVKARRYKKVLLLASKFTMEDGFFAQTLEKNNIHVVIPSQTERDKMHVIHSELMNNQITEDARLFFTDLIAKQHNLDAVILGCTEFPMLVKQENSKLPIIDPVHLQASAAVDFALGAL